MKRGRLIIIRNAAHADFGGGERFPIFLATALRDIGWQPIVVSKSKKLLAFAKEGSIASVHGWWWSKQNWSGVKVLFTPVYFAWQVILYFYYIALFVKHRPTVVHIQSKDDFIAGTFAARTLGLRVIWTDHADLKHVWRNLRVWYKNPIGKAVYIAAYLTHKITVVSNSEERLVKRHLSGSSAVKGKITVVYNGVFDRKDEYPRQEDAETVRFVVASRLVTDKGIGEVIEAFSKLRSEHADVSLAILGDGPDRAHLETLPGAENVKFLGHVTDPLKNLAVADVFVHPTYHEGFSVALVEASMMSLPIIATFVGGNVEIIQDHKTGLLIPARDSLALYEAMKELLADENARKLYGKNARNQYLRRFEFNRIVADEFIPLYGRK